ncbi:RNase H [Trametes versicolor FP-101664 SS1]|uniref:RNase H n=1 Tax=Trametes versicolor (strain FP-101664) TaxID=717944 RepID=UPI0004623C21|nr:RNase H [Trametes versicolor FP-101664 SS1]EIW56838.1 RNase H [Trametes versicolor FP-101664 SS1]
MLKAAKKYGARIDVKNPTDALKEALPVWSHIGPYTGRVMSNSRTSKCLRERHNVATVGACVQLIRRLSGPPTAGNAHIPSRGCTCGECVTDREIHGCLNPHKCVISARDLLNKLTPAWAPGGGAHCDGLTLTKSRKRKNNVERGRNGRLLFDPSITSTAPLAHAIRVFTTEDERLTLLRRAPRPYNVPTEDISVYTDGSYKEDGAAGPRSGAGVWFADADPRNIAAPVPGDTQSNQVAEIYAVSLAVHTVPPFAPLTIISDSKMIAAGQELRTPTF